MLVGLPDVVVTGVGEWPSWLRIAIEARYQRPVCAGCGIGAHGHGRRVVVLVDLPVFGRAGAAGVDQAPVALPAVLGQLDRAGPAHRVDTFAVDDAGWAVGDTPSWPSRSFGG